ncbi:MAG TPA: T9SS type A sorting domain-containing protein [Bacteroidales bacterium]|nr:T9SS type A sorting domain-containing protein [Bacteroidales bacterium]
MMKKNQVLTFIFACCLFALSAQDTLYVKSDTDAWQGKTAYTNLQTAIDAATAGDQIWVAEGIYYPTSGIEGGTGRYRSFIMKSNIAIYGGFEGTENALSERQIIENEWGIDFAHPTILSGDINQTPGTNTDDVYHVLWYGNVTLATQVTINGFIVKNGYANGTEDIHQKGGAAVLQDACTIAYCVFQQNYAATQGGAIYLNPGSSISHCYFNDNHLLYASGKGGALYAATNSFLEIIVSYCSFEANTITTTNSEGGAFYSGNNNIFANNRFRYNDCTKNGGAACVSSGTQFQNCTFEQNHATNGGAIYSSNTNLVISNCLFNNNSSNTKGGAVYTTSSGCKIINCTLVGNNSGEGGAVYGNSNLMMFNAIVWNNAADIDSQISSGISCLYSAVQDVLMSGTGNLNISADNAADVQFVNPATVIGLPMTAQDSLEIATADYTINGLSVCRESGSTSNLQLSGYMFPETDLAGNPRIDGENIDMGAYEKQCLIETPELQYIVTDTIDPNSIIVEFEILNYDENITYEFLVNNELQSLQNGICEMTITAPDTLECHILAQNTGTGCQAEVMETFIFDSIHYTSILENEWGGFIIYPNPTSDEVHFDAEEWQNQNYQVEIYNIQGERIQQLNLNKETTISLKHLSSGVYFIEIKNNHFKQSYKIIKK